mmetsp:Transcript_98598/g.195613  ORF Transcript_98598/g.195613 Transcript_98598/m.195613 type:complete len:701 (+) Transcript_98598:55-2157(+)|eukprot:CAMPEP_0172835010 /NCGR_PEP_ID=MMETSP1075-20121228/25432_1 /TAXON_ID=2916 /ORGANISM="Ceratium fusus, Strain PA161109" /LENGTH=700 /DNA_ID=CAMNT_0013677981 /DNA_START=30 /DNA_END=2132 /DNA_ORIENTATION=+
MASIERWNGDRSPSKHQPTLSPLGTSKRLAQRSQEGARACLVSPAPTEEWFPLGPRSLSRFGIIANERAAEAESELGMHFVSQGQQESLDGGVASNARRQSGWDVELSRQAYDRLMEEINTAFTGPSTPIQVLRKDEVVSESILFRGTRHYKIPLPSKPTAITAMVKVSAGVDPTLYASTSCERPSSKDHELCGRDNKLIYEHALLSASEELDLGLDRRHAVPVCRELFLGIEAEAGECSFRLTVAFKHIKVVLSRAEIAFRMQNIRQGWKARLVQLNREPAQREQFEEYVQALQDEREFAKRERHRGVNFVDRNMRSLSNASPRIKLSTLQARSVAVSAKHDEVAARREKLEQDLNLRNTYWISQREERRQRRAHEHQQQQRIQLAQEFQCQWLSRLTAIAFALRAGFDFQIAKEEREHVRRRMRASGVLRKFLVCKLFRRRRTHLYINVIKWFLVACVVNPESLSLGNALKRFRTRAIRIQRWWRGIHEDSANHVFGFLERWTASKASQERMTTLRVAESFGSSPRRSIRLVTGEKGTPHQAGCQQFAHQAVLTMSHAALPDPDGLQVTASRPLPASLARTIMSDYVSSMRRSYGKRMKDWEKKKQAAQWAKDLEGFGVRADKSVRSRQAVSKKRPQRLYKDMEELDRIIRQAEEAWNSGKLKVEGFQHLRPLRFPFAAWARSTKYAANNQAKQPGIT